MDLKLWARDMLLVGLGVLLSLAISVAASQINPTEINQAIPRPLPSADATKGLILHAPTESSLGKACLDIRSLRADLTDLIRAELQKSREDLSKQPERPVAITTFMKN